MAAPHRTKLLKETVAPTEMKSNTDKDEASFVNPNTEREAPKRANARRDKVEPTLK
jgi:hypothetical protein